MNEEDLTKIIDWLIEHHPWMADVDPDKLREIILEIGDLNPEKFD